MNAQKDRFKQVRKMLGLTQRELAQAIGVTDSTIRRYELGMTEIPKTTALALKALFHVNPTWLLTGEGKMFLEEKAATIKGEKKPVVVDIKPLPIIDSQVPADFPQIKAQVIGWLYLPEVETMPNNAMVVKVKGQCMRPTVKEGDYVIFVPADRESVKNGEVVVVQNKWNELVVKRFRERNGEMFLTNDNLEYPELKFEMSSFKIVGRVLKKVRMEDIF
jgi:phage repressor protein C with HTH and peptisase S24 domain